MNLRELIEKNWKQISLQILPEEIANSLPMIDGIRVADMIGREDFFDEGMKNYSLTLLEAIRLAHANEWESSWRYDAFLGQCYYFIFEPEKAFEAYKSAMKKAPAKLHPGLLIALGGCTGMPGDVSVGDDKALNYLKMAIKDYLYIDAALLLRSIYRLKNDTVNKEFWTEMLAKALKLGMFVPSLEQAVYETDEDDARRGWKYKPDIDMKRAKALEEELRDVLPRPLDDRGMQNFY